MKSMPVSEVYLSLYYNNQCYCEQYVSIIFRGEYGLSQYSEIKNVSCVILNTLNMLTSSSTGTESIFESPAL